MAMAAEHTERVEICSSVTIAFPRTPMILAQSAWDMQQLSGGRINIGLGSQVKGHNVRRFGGTWTPPAKRMEDYIGMMRAAWHSWQTGERPGYISDNYTYTLMTPMFDPGPIDYPHPKISLANVGPLMARVAGACADGLRPHGFMTHRYMMDTVLPNVKKGAERAGRSIDDIEISVGGFTAFGETESEVEAGDRRAAAADLLLRLDADLPPRLRGARLRFAGDATARALGCAASGTRWPKRSTSRWRRRWPTRAPGTTCPSTRERI